MQSEPPNKLSRLGLVAPRYAATKELAEDFALAIYSYSLEHLSLSEAVNRSMLDPQRQVEGSEAARRLAACLPYIKFLEAALEALPEALIHRTVDRGIKCHRDAKLCFPGDVDCDGGAGLQGHDVERHYPTGSVVCWYHFCWTSETPKVMEHTQLGALDARPRTVFEVDVCLGFRVSALTYGGEEEPVVLLPPLSELEVVAVVQQCDGALPVDTQHAGFTDTVKLKQLPSGSFLERQVTQLREELRRETHARGEERRAKEAAVAQVTQERRAKEAAVAQLETERAAKEAVVAQLEVAVAQVVVEMRSKEAVVVELEEERRAREAVVAEVVAERQAKEMAEVEVEWERQAREAAMAEVQIKREARDAALLRAEVERVAREAAEAKVEVEQAEREEAVAQATAAALASAREEAAATQAAAVAAARAAAARDVEELQRQLREALHIGGGGGGGRLGGC